MGRLRIVKPIPYTVTGGVMVGAQRVATPSPKEAAIAVGSYGNNDILVGLDFGADVQIDTLIVGYIVNSLPLLEIRYGATTGVGGVIANVSAALGDGLPPYFYLVTLPTPVLARYIEIRPAPGTTTAPYFTVGVVAAGLAVMPFYGREWGAGRTIDDASNVERLFGGGFGIDQGAITTGYQWTCGDLQPEEVVSLYRIARSVGVSRSILVIEDDDAPAVGERIHWGLFRKLEAYERLDPSNTRWSFQIWDWA